MEPRPKTAVTTVLTRGVA